MKKLCVRCGLVRIAKKGRMLCNPCRKIQNENRIVKTVICKHCGSPFSKFAYEFKSYYGLNRGMFCNRHCYDKSKVGAGNPGWKGGIRSLKQTLHHSEKMREWRNSVFERDGYKCFYCEKRGNLEAHHIIPIAKILDAYCFYNGNLNLDGLMEYAPLWNVANGVALCESCHNTIPKRTKAHEIFIPPELVEKRMNSDCVYVFVRGLSNG